MATQFFDLPLELRLKVYSLTFGCEPVILHGGRQDTGINAAQPSLLPSNATVLNGRGRSSQLLRTCKTILDEARPVLYENTHFQTVTDAFAGRLPTHFTTSHPTASQVQSLTWQLRCDMLKKLYPEDLKLYQIDFPNLKHLEIKCQAENWRGLACGQFYTDESFIRGRQQIIEYAKLIQNKMSRPEQPVRLIEDQRSLKKARVVLRLTRSSQRLSVDEMEII